MATAQDVSRPGNSLASPCRHRASSLQAISPPLLSTGPPSPGLASCKSPTQQASLVAATPERPEQGQSHQPPTPTIKSLLSRAPRYSQVLLKKHTPEDKTVPLHQGTVLRSGAPWHPPIFRVQTCRHDSGVRLLLYLSTEASASMEEAQLYRESRQRVCRAD